MPYQKYRAGIGRRFLAGNTAPSRAARSAGKIASGSSAHQWHDAGRRRRRRRALRGIDYFAGAAIGDEARMKQALGDESFGFFPRYPRRRWQSLMILPVRRLRGRHDDRHAGIAAPLARRQAPRRRSSAIPRGDDRCSAGGAHCR